MFRYAGKRLRPERKLEDYPSFGPVRPRSHARSTVLLMAGTLLLAPLCTGASLGLVDGAAAGGFPEAGRAVRPLSLQQGCDGAWGNEPLDCLLQAA